jgi:phosphatidylinositol alpha-1,6-mannosyltransferase
MLSGIIRPPQAAIRLLTHEFEPFRGGAGAYTREIALAGARGGIPMEVVASDYHRRLDDAGAGFPVVRLRSSGRLTPAGVLGFAAGLFSHRRDFRGAPTILLSTGAHMAAILVHAAGLFWPERTLAFFHGSEALRLASHPFWRPLARRLYAKCAGAAVASRYVEGLVRESGLLPGGLPIALAPPAVPSFFAQQPNVPVDDGILRILTVGRLHPRKGQLELALALGQMPGELRSRVLYQMAGAGSEAYRRKIEAACANGGIRAEFLGQTGDCALPGLYARCAIYAQASHRAGNSVEGFGISLLEAQFHGCPAVSCRTGGVPEAVRDGETGLLVPENDQPALTNALARLIADPALRLALGHAGRVFARGFSWEDSARILAKFASN